MINGDPGPSVEILCVNTFVAPDGLSDARWK